MKTDYMRSDTKLLPYLPYPRFLLEADFTQTARKLAPNKISNSNLKNNLSGVSNRPHPQSRYQNVFLSNTELSELQSDFPTVWQEYIERLSEYMASTGRTYKSHAATIRRWVTKDKKGGIPDYSCKEGESL